MIRVIGVVILVWLILMPPLFTEGACTAEFDQVSTQLQTHKKDLATSASAQAFWGAMPVSMQVISASQCRMVKPRFVDECGYGDLIYIKVPVKNRVCHFYRDSAIRVQLQYDGNGRLEGELIDMNPFKYLALPWIGKTIYWGR
ncbi:MAG TPA: hypothetical protein VF848_12205 [Steroidobacteraceae bacterium]